MIQSQLKLELKIAFELDVLAIIIGKEFQHNVVSKYADGRILWHLLDASVGCSKFA